MPRVTERIRLPPPAGAALPRVTRIPVMTHSPIEADRDAPASLRLGISACLLGHEVRWDGGHKRDSFLIGTVGQFVEWVPVCPEVEVGMSTPRETLRLVSGSGGEADVRMVTTKGGEDHTAPMQRWARKRVRELADEDLDGYVLKRDSPSCGMERVKIYDGKGGVRRKGSGLFAAELTGRNPLLPCEEEGRLNDPMLRENFLERIFAFRRLRAAFRPRWTVGDLVRFHTAEKLQLMAHDVQAYRELGRMVAGAKGTDRRELAERYQASYMAAMKKLATVRKHTNVLQHMQGWFSKQLSDDERAELTQLIADYRAGLVPLVVPVTLIRHHVRRLDVEYLQGQTYLQPAPKELMLRNHA